MDGYCFCQRERDERERMERERQIDGGKRERWRQREGDVLHILSDRQPVWLLH